MTTGPPRGALVGILLGVTALKLWLASFWGHTADIPQTYAQGRALLDGLSLMDPAHTGRNPSFFLPGHFLIAAAGILISEATGLAFPFVIKVPSILADLAVAWLLHARRPGGDHTAALLYMLNPLTFLLGVYHGQLHTVAAAFAALGLVLHERGSPAGPGLALALATAVRQHFALFLAPLALPADWRERVRLLAPSAALFAFVAATVPEFQRAAAPVANYGSWGVAMLLLQVPRVARLAGLATGGLQVVNDAVRVGGPLLYWGWAAGFVAWCLARARHGPLDPWRAGLLFLCGLYAVAPGFGVQWLSWAVPFWIVVDRRGAAVYSLLGGAYLAGSYWQYTLNPRYGLASITANLHLLSRGDLLGVLAVGTLGLAAWLFCSWTAWRLLRATETSPPSPPSR